MMDTSGQASASFSEAENPPAISLHELQFSYQGPKGIPVLHIRSWQVCQGQRIFLYGPSGSGKSTLLNLIAGTLSPTAGTIELFGQPFSSLSSRKRDHMRARHIGIVFQQFNLIPYLSVKENIRVAAYFARNLTAAFEDRVAYLFNQLQLPTELLNSRADNLSVGQQQRVAIARALINQPQLLIVDEPTSALDAEARDGFMNLLLATCEETDTTLLFVSHDQSLAQHFTLQQDIRELNTIRDHA